MEQAHVNASTDARPAEPQGRAAAWDPGRWGLFRGMSSARRYQVLVAALVLFVLLAVGLMSLYIVQAGQRGARIETATHLQMLSQRYSKTAQQAVLGNKAAFVQLKDSRDGFARGLAALDASTGGFSAQTDLAGLKKRWQTSAQDIDKLITQEAALVALGQSIQAINRGSDTLFDLAEQLAARLPGGKALSASHQLALWSQRMARNATTLMVGDVISPEVAYRLGQDVKAFGEAVDGMLNGDANLGLVAVADADARDRLNKLKGAYTAFAGQVDVILKNMPRLVEAKRAARELFDQSEQILSLTGKLTRDYQNDLGWLYLVLALGSGVIALAALVLLALNNVAESRQRAEQAAQDAARAAQEQEAAAHENRRNQEAILRLLNEMGDLAEGNLTIRATVTEDITGAIADSVNFAIEELRTLVENVNRAAGQVTQATDAAKGLAQDMLATAERQADDIGQTTGSVQVMTDSVHRVAENAAQSAHVAEQSLEFARKGGDSVRAAIAGMNAIRDQIQETSKRIKRLGESSQEIGEIVELISDITEQTNVLALNAAIQAAAAGEAGRGFSVVAEEVQRLAERSGQATRRIGAIVKSIQTDTQDTIHAMEGSTRGVVQGAALSDNAGHALQDIESVSADLARLIQNISDATREQVEIANRIDANMQRVLEQTRQASDGARQSAASVGELAVLADELRVSVAGFTL